MDLFLRQGLVTGASGVLGQALCRDLAAAGARLFLHYHRNETAIRALAADLGDRLGGAVAADLGTRAGVERVAAFLKRDVDRLDFLVTAHGLADYRPLPLFGWEDIERLVTVNLTSHLALVAAAYDRLRRSRGTVILVGSTAALRGSSCETPYGAAKAGLVGLAASLRQELRGEGVRVGVLAPGAFLSPMTEGRTPTPLTPKTTPADVAAALHRLLASDGDLPLVREVPT